MPIGLAFIVGQLGLGGAEQQLYYLLSGLDRSRFRPAVITLGPRANEYWVQPIRTLGIEVWHVGHSLGRLGRIIEIGRRLHSERVKIVHSWDLHTNPYAAVAGRLAATHLRLGSMRLDYHGMPNDRMVRWVGYRGLDVLITNSETATDHVRKCQLTEAEVRFVPNGVRIPEPTNQSDRTRLRAELGISETDLLVGSIGRLDANKNHAMLLRVFGSLSATWKMLRLVIIGDGPLKSELAAMAERLGITSKVNFPGAIPLAARYLPAMDICCLSSYTEGMPNLVMEAAAAGVPVVSTRCGDSANLIECGISGYLVAPDDDMAMGVHISGLLADTERRFRIGLAAREKMRREFCLADMVTRMTMLYEEFLHRRKISGGPRSEALLA